MFSSRFKKIISMFYEQVEFISYQSIADHLQISTRTVMREIAQNKAALQDFGLELELKKSHGLFLKGSFDDKEKLRYQIEGLKVDYVDKEERQELLCIALLSAKEVEKLFYYSNMFQVSQATISHDIDTLESFFKKYNLFVERRPGIGVLLTGDELDKRKAMSVVIQKTMNRSESLIKHDRYSVDEVIAQIKSQEGATFVQLLDYDVLKGILEVFVKYRTELQLDDIAQSSYFGLLIHLSIAITRVLQKQTLVIDVEKINYKVDQEYLDRALFMATHLEKKFQITFPKIESVFIAIHLQSAKVSTVSYNNVDDVNHELIINFFNALKKQNAEFTLDHELYQNMAAHLKPAMIRHKNNMPIYNPLLEQIKTQYRSTFIAVKKASYVFSDKYGNTLNDDEVGYLVLHVAASLERNKGEKKKRQKIQVGIICASGIGVSSLLVARVKKIVDSNVELVQLSLGQIDTIDCPMYIATFDIKKENAIIINPLLLQSDVVNILKKIEDVRSKQNQYHEYKRRKLNILQYAMQIQKLLDNITVHRVSSTITSKEVLSLFSKISDHSDEVEKQLIQREEINSNIYHDFHFALFHTSLDSIDDCYLQVATCDEGEFQDESLHNIKIILCGFIPIVATLEQQKMMSYTTTLFIEQPDIIEELQSIDKTKEILEEYLQEALAIAVNE